LIKWGKSAPNGAYPFVLQRISEPIGVVAPIAEQPVDIGQAAEQRSRPDVITDLASGDEEADRAAVAVADGMQLGVPFSGETVPRTVS